MDKDDNGCLQVRLIDRSYIKALANQVRDILATDQEGSMLIQEFTKVFKERWENFLYQAFCFSFKLDYFLSELLTSTSENEKEAKSR